MILTVSQMQEVEKAAFARGIKALDLMQQAGKGIVEVVQQFFTVSGQCILYCGKGNNAGDVLVAGRFLAAAGWKVFLRAAFSEQEMSGLAQQQLQYLKKENLFFCDDDFHLRSKIEPLVLLDGLLGIGAQGEPRGEIHNLIEELNELRRVEGAFAVAADLPSGLDGTTGKPSRSCVEADLTVAIAFPKIGLFADEATNYVGRLAVVPLSDLKATQGSSEKIITAETLRTLLPPRSFDVHKGIFGHVGIIAGSRGYLGAARLASTASLHAGAGLVTLYALPETYKLFATSLPPEVMVKPINSYLEIFSENLDALAIGPGLGSDHHSEILEVIEKVTIPCLVDADALNVLTSEMSRLLKTQGPRLLTPHPGEMERLFPREQRTRAQWAADFVKQYPVTLLLKGARTIIAEHKMSLTYNMTGNPGMASGGMGDVLSGVAVAFLASGHNPREAAMLGAWLCGHAAELAIFGGSVSQESLVASDVIINFGRAINNLRCGVF